MFSHVVCVFLSKANSKILSPLFAAYDAQLDEQAKTMELYRVRCTPDTSTLLASMRVVRCSPYACFTLWLADWCF